MGYVAVRGGGAAIEESLNLLEYQRTSTSQGVSVASIEENFPGIIDQIMGESSLYSPHLAALAFKQAEGSVEEAVFLLRAFRSTLERPYVSRPMDMATMTADRRISAAFKDVPGGQILGATRDYSHRLINFDLETETDQERFLAHEALANHFTEANAAANASSNAATLPKVLDYLRNEGLLPNVQDNDEEPVDVTMGLIQFPCARSARLQTLSRGMTQAVDALGYAAIRGFGAGHPTVGELRHGNVEVCVDHPLADGNACVEDSYYVGSIPLTEVESVFETETEDENGTHLSFKIGYGLVMGASETKAIAMSVLDNCLETPDDATPVQNEEFVLYHVDCVEAQGFISHLKLPHYVTFQSKLDAVRTTKG